MLTDSHLFFIRPGDILPSILLFVTICSNLFISYDVPYKSCLSNCDNHLSFVCIGCPKDLDGVFLFVHESLIILLKSYISVASVVC